MSITPHDALMCLVLMCGLLAAFIVLGLVINTLMYGPLDKRRIARWDE